MGFNLQGRDLLSLVHHSEREILHLIFLPGFSLAAKVTDVSGRGVGMDVVKTRIEAIGAVDELNSQMGVLLDTPIPADLRPLLVDIQHDLFNLGAELAWPEVSQLHEENVLRLDQASMTSLSESSFSVPA